MSTLKSTLLILSSLTMSTLVLSELARAQGISQDEFRFRSDAITRSQGQTDSALKRIAGGQGVNPFGSTTQSVGHDGNEKKPKPLFVQHGDLRSSSLSTGKLLFGRVYTRLVVGPEGSPVLIELDNNQGSFSRRRIYGTARQSSTQGRLLLELNRYLLLGGGFVPITAVALDASGALGIEAEVFSGKALAVAGAMAGSFIAGLAATQQTQAVTPLGFSQTQPTGRNAILGGVAQTAADQSKRLIDEATTEKPTLVVEADTQVAVMIQEEVRF